MYVCMYVCKEGDPSGMRVILKYKQDLELKNGLLYQKVQLQHQDKIRHQFVLPEGYQKEQVWLYMMILEMEKMLGLLKDMFFGQR